MKGYAELLSKLKEISGLGYIKTHRTGDTGMMMAETAMAASIRVPSMFMDAKIETCIEPDRIYGILIDCHRL